MAMDEMTQCRNIRDANVTASSLMEGNDTTLRKFGQGAADGLKSNAEKFSDVGAAQVKVNLVCPASPVGQSSGPHQKKVGDAGFRGQGSD